MTVFIVFKTKKVKQKITRVDYPVETKERAQNNYQLNIFLLYDKIKEKKEV